MEEGDSHRRLLDAAERVLSQGLGRPVRLAGAEVLGSSERSQVLRCAVAEGPEALGATARRLAAQLRNRWPAEADAMPLYPALRN